LKIVLDAGNGAASTYGAAPLRAAGAAVVLLHAASGRPERQRELRLDRPQEMASRVLAEGAHLGAAFDGDADRAILADEAGWSATATPSSISGDSPEAAGKLQPAKIVATSMSNLGLERALAARGSASCAATWATATWSRPWSGRGSSWGRAVGAHRLLQPVGDGDGC